MRWERDRKLSRVRWSGPWFVTHQNHAARWVRRANAHIKSGYELMDQPGKSLRRSPLRTSLREHRASSKIAGMPAHVPRSQLKAIVAAVFVVFPAILYYAILFRKALNLPFDDDYEGLVDFLNQMAILRSGPAKTSYFFAAQYNEYKIFFARGSAWLVLRLFGHIDMKLLCAIGNGFVLVLAILLWKMFLPNTKNLAARLAFFIPVSWLLFQLQYVETLDWAMASLANLPVLVFSLGAIYCLMRATRWAFFGALVCLVLAVASMGNGLLMIPIGALVLALRRRYARVLVWIVISIVCVGAYAYHYNFLSSQSRLNHSVLATVVRPRPLYVIAFIGNAAAFPVGGPYILLEILLSLFLGILLSIFVVVLVRRGYPRRNPLVSYCVLFLLLSAVGVAGLRSDIGLKQSLDSRYAIYSALLVIFAWFAVVEEFLQREWAPLCPNRILLVAIGGSVLFSLTMDVFGWHYLTERNRQIIRGMIAYQHPALPGSSIGPILPFVGQNARFDELDRRAHEALGQAIRLGIYRPPAY